MEEAENKKELTINLEDQKIICTDKSSIDFVIDSLIRVCDHTLEQAEQCTILVHYKGKCTVKSGEYKDLDE